MLMLASLRGVTEAAAKGIVREYPTIRDLYEAWEACGSERDRREMLAGVAVSLCLGSKGEGGADAVLLRRAERTSRHRRKNRPSYRKGGLGVRLQGVHFP